MSHGTEKCNELSEKGYTLNLKQNHVQDLLNSSNVHETRTKKSLLSSYMTVANSIGESPCFVGNFLGNKMLKSQFVLFERRGALAFLNFPSAFVLVANHFLSILDPVHCATGMSPVIFFTGRCLPILLLA